MISHPRVSIILPTYNGAFLIERAIRSILAQSFKDLELIIVDDGSTDETASIVKKMMATDERIVYTKNERNSGLQKTLNIGLAQAKGEYFARIDDDDEWIDEKKLEQQISFLDENKEYVLVGTGAIILNKKRKEMFRYLMPGEDGEIRNSLLSKNCFVHSSVVLRKDSVRNIGGYDESPATLHVEDYDLWLRLGKIGKLHNLGVYATVCTHGEESLTSKHHTEQFKKSIALIKKYRHEYPNYSSGLFKARIRFFLFSSFHFLIPTFVMHAVKKIYKKIW